ncbi:MAG: glutaredoxin family protein [Candidatus Brocadiae bacterium]|nr:glutaredoxin family protein [Candidatus Brocadiia bacterium]
MPPTAPAVTIYGKAGCPYTTAAREAYGKKGKVTYVDVQKDAAQLEAMLKLSKGARRVPVIVDNGTVTVGYEGS